MVHSTILIIDDDDGVRKALAGLIRAEGYGVETTSNVRDGLRKMREIIPRMILLDLRVPEHVWSEVPSSTAYR